MQSPYTGIPPAVQNKLANVVAMAEDFLRPHRLKFDRVLAVVAPAHQLTPDALTRAGKSRHLVAAKREALALAVEILNPPLSPESLGDWLNLSRSAAYRLLADARARAEKEPTYAAHLDTLRTRIRATLNTEEKPDGQ